MNILTKVSKVAYLKETSKSEYAYFKLFMNVLCSVLLYYFIFEGKFR